MNIWTPIFGFILGACLGSFLNVCIDRLPLGQSLIHPSSHCANCGKKLKAFELIPLVSYLWLKGRCRYCSTDIPRRIFAVELVTGFLLSFISFSYGFGLKFLVLTFYSCLFLVLAVIDLEYRLILNKIVYPAIGIGLILAPFWSNLGFSRALLGENTMLYALLNSLIGGTIFAAPLLLIALFYKNGMGWGDVKMAGLIGLATGFPSVLVAMFIAFLSGGLTALFLLLFHLKGRREVIPFAPFLSLGAFVTLLWGQDLIIWYLEHIKIIY